MNPKISPKSTPLLWKFRAAAMVTVRGRKIKKNTSLTSIKLQVPARKISCIERLWLPRWIQRCTYSYHRQTEALVLLLLNWICSCSGSSTILPLPLPHIFLLFPKPPALFRSFYGSFNFAKLSIKLSFVQYILLSRRHTILWHIYVLCKTREGGWDHPSWPCSCLATYLPISHIVHGMPLIM